jgi:hypothetical protein
MAKISGLRTPTNWSRYEKIAGKSVCKICQREYPCGGSYCSEAEYLINKALDARTMRVRNNAIVLAVKRLISGTRYAEGWRAGRAEAGEPVRSEGGS